MVQSYEESETQTPNRCITDTRTPGHRPPHGATLRALTHSTTPDHDSIN